MSKENLTKPTGDATKSANQKQDSQSSVFNAQNDLTKQSSQTNGESTSAKATNNNHNSTPNASPNNSPTKGTPNKSKNKKRNDAKRRSANIKKQQQSQAANSTGSPYRSDKMKPGTKLADDSLNNSSQQESGTQQQKRDHQTPSPSPRATTTNNQQQNNQLKQMDNESAKESTKQQTDNESAKESTKQQTSANPSSQPNNIVGENNVSTSSNTNHNNINSDIGQHRSGSDTNSWRRKQRENLELREQLKLRDAQLENLADRVKQQINKTKELEASLVSTTRTCGQFEKLLQQELTNRNKLEAENDVLNQTLNRLKNQISAHEKERSANNELIRVLNATLMERETEVSILKLKMTRLQTNSSANISQFNPPSNPSLTRQDPCKAYTMAGRSNSEFARNSSVRSTMMADAINTRSSTSQLQSDDRDALLWANVPEELTPSKRPILLERNLPQLYEQCHNISGTLASPIRNQSSTPISRDRRYRTLPISMKNPIQPSDCDSYNRVEQQPDAGLSNSKDTLDKQPANCLITNLDESNTTSQSSGNRSSVEANSNINSEIKTMAQTEVSGLPTMSSSEESKTSKIDDNSATLEDNQKTKTVDTTNHYYSINDSHTQHPTPSDFPAISLEKTKPPPNLAPKSPSTPLGISAGFKRIFGKFKRSDSSSSESRSRSDLRNIDPPLTPTTNAFQRGANRSTLVGPPSSTFRAQMSPLRTIDFQTDKPFADWDTNMLVDWLTMIGLSMYANQCRRWVECGAHIMNATPAEVDKGLGITNHLHRKKLRLAISELNGDCDKITKAASKLDYLWVARWLDDIGLPQYKEAFINARVDGRVLNYLTVEDLVSMGVKSLLHHSSIRCGIRVLRSINFDLQLLKRRATAEEIEQMNSVRDIMVVQSDNSTSDKTTIDEQQVRICDESDVPLWTCHRIMEWLRMIDFAEFAPNLRGSGVHGGLIMYEDGFNIDTMSTLLSIPSSRTLLRRHLATFFENLIGKELEQRKRQYRELSTNQRLDPASEIKNPKKSALWFAKLKSSKVGQDGMDEYLCPMYPVEPQIIKSPTRKSEPNRREVSNLPRIPESINV